MADELFERGAQAAGVAGQPFAEELQQVMLDKHDEEREKVPRGEDCRPSRPSLSLGFVHLDWVRKRRIEEPRVSVEASDMVTIPRAELDALKAELRRLRREVGRGIAKGRVETDPGPSDDAPTFTREELARAWGISE
jgi:hypothetical protein